VDTITLVDELIEDGQRLIDSLLGDRIPVRIACWVKPVEEDRWSLFIGTPLIDQKGAAQAYREVYRVLRGLGPTWVTDSDVKLIGESHPITKEILEIRQRFPGKGAARSRRPTLGGIPIEEIYVYPLIAQSSPLFLGQRKLKRDVKQIDRPEDFLLAPEDRLVVRQLMAQGISEQQAYALVLERRQKGALRPPIPAGTIVKAWIAAHWGDSPEDDPNPLLRIEAEDGAHGITSKNDTDPV